MKYLEQAYYTFEKENEVLLPEKWLEFNRKFRRDYDKLPKKARLDNASNCPIFNKLAAISVKMNSFTHKPKEDLK